MNTFFATAWEWVKGIGSVVAVLSFIIEFTPIKLHPLRFICSKLGKALNSDIKKEIETIKTEMETIRTDVKNLGDSLQKTETSLTKKIEENDLTQTERYIKQLRGEILEFSNSCMNGTLHTKDEFEHIIDKHEEYEKLLESLGRTNGVVTLEFEYISDVYQKCCKKNSFL